MNLSLTDKQQEVVMSSPAFKDQSEHYPKHWRGMVPVRVGMLKTVRSDLPGRVGADLVCREDEIYAAFVNRHGTVSAVFPDGSLLGLKPMEFCVTKFQLASDGGA